MICSPIPKSRTPSKPNPRIDQQVSTLVAKALNKNIEKKYVYINSGGVTQNYTSAGVLLYLSAISEGTSDSTRTGDMVRYQHLTLRMRFVVSGTPPDVCRVIVWRFKPAWTAAPAADYPLFESPSLDYQTAMSAISPKRMQDVVILRDEYFTLSTVGTNIYAPTFEIPLQNVEATYSTAGQTNGLFVSIFGEGVPVNTYVYNSQLCYTDA